MYKNVMGDSEDAANLAILVSLKSDINFSLQKDRNRRCVPGTGLWFFHHPVYEAFQNGKDSQLLFITAEAGGGKSTLMRTLADQLLESPQNPLVAYFFFKDDDDRLRSYEEALSGLIHQLLSQDRNLFKHAKDMHDIHKAGLKHNTKAMWDILSRIAAHASQDVFCLFDAVDECDAAGRAQLEADIQDYFQSARSVNSRLKFMIFSRPYEDESHQYFDIFSDSVDNMRHLAGEDAEVQLDILNVIRAKIEHLIRKRDLDEAVKETLVEKIFEQNRQTRSFLAVHMAFELLDSHPRMHEGASERTIGSILADIPNSLGKQFDKMLSQSSDPEHARKLFCVILAARRTIKLDEFKLLYALTESKDPSIAAPQSYDDLELPPDDDEFKKLVRSRCGLFITFVRNSVHLFHQTAREHLVARERQLDPQSDLAQLGKSRGSSWKGSITLSDANLVFSMICLDILRLPIPESLPWDAFDSLESGNNWDTEAKEFIAQRPFYEYAACNWYAHVSAAGDAATRVLASEQYNAIIDVSKPEFWGWFLAVSYHVCSNLMKKKVPISDIWTEEKDYGRKHDYGIFLREGCIGKLFTMNDKLRALLGDDKKFVHNSSPDPGTIPWKADRGLRWIDRFHQAYGEKDWTSTYRAAHATEQGDTERASLLLADTSTPDLIWTALTEGLPNSLQKALNSVDDLSWLRAMPEYIMYPHAKWHGSSTRDGKSLREERNKGWKQPYPPTFVAFLKASTLPSNEELFRALADWVQKHERSQEFAMELWEAGGFIASSFAHRLVAFGANVDSEQWEGDRTALQIAASFWVHDTVATLLELGADPSKRTVNGYNTLHWFFYYEKLDMGDNLSFRDVQSKTLKHLNKRTSIASSVRAIANGASDKYILFSQTCEKGQTPLMHAVHSMRSSPTAVKTMLEEGAEVDQRDEQGATALMHFLTAKGFVSKSTKIINELLLAGADSRATDTAGNSVLQYLAKLIESQQLSNLYPGFNAYTKSFDALAKIGPLSQFQVMCKELQNVKIPMAAAVRLGNAPLCLALLTAGNNPNEHGIEQGSRLEYNSGSTSDDLEDLEFNPLMIALQSSAYVTAVVLLEHGTTVDIQLKGRDRGRLMKHRRTKQGATPLHLAVSGGSESSWHTFRDLTIDSGFTDEGCAFGPAANPDYKIGNLSHEQMLKRLGCRCRDRKKEREEDSDPEYERRKSAFVNESLGSSLLPFDTLEGIKGAPTITENPLLSIVADREATQEQRQEALVEYLLSKGNSPNANTINNITPLMISAAAGKSNLVKLLLQYGADPNIADKSTNGSTALMRAAYGGHTDVVEQLLKAGANPNAKLRPPGPRKCKCSSFVEWSSFLNRTCEAPLTALALAARYNRKDTVEVLLKHGADPNLKIVHHAHGRILSRKEKRRKKRDYNSPSSSEDEVEPEAEGSLWKGHIGVATSLTWARGQVRDILLAHGADPGVEEALRKCGCTIKPKPKKENSRPWESDSDSDTEHEEDISQDWEKV